MDIKITSQLLGLRLVSEAEILGCNLQNLASRAIQSFGHQVVQLMKLFATGLGQQTYHSFHNTTVNCQEDEESFRRVKAGDNLQRSN